MNSVWELISFVTRSNYRRKSIEIINELEEATPSTISEMSGIPQPHVSRALTELRENELIELLVPEEQSKGRFYGTTELGEFVVQELPPEATVEGLGIEQELEPKEEELISYLKKQYRRSLLSVIKGDYDSMTVFYLNDSIVEENDLQFVENWLTKSIRESLRTYNHRKESLGELKYDATGTKEFNRVLIYLGDGKQIRVAIDSDSSFELPHLAEKCSNILDR